MNPLVKYTMARLVMFLALVAILLALPLPVSSFVRVMLALLLSMTLSFFVLKKQRDEMSDYIANSVQRRQAEKQKLQAALSGEESAEAPDGPTLSNQEN